VLRAGRWVWASAESGAADVECPACHRIAQDLPDGIVTIAGRFAEARAAEIRSLLRNVEENEKREHALARSFGIEVGKEGMVVKTTERRLAESLGRALERAYGGTLTRKEGDRSGPLRVHWQRE
jgi:hypothetical protein